MKKIIVGNLKMNLTYDEIINYINKMDKKNDDLDLIIAPSNIYLPLFDSVSFSLCAQNAFGEDSGAFTGEVSAKQIKSLGVGYVIIGHSERRRLLNESDRLINSKLIGSLNAGLTVILCVGETKQEREGDRTIGVINRQITSALEKVDKELINNVIIAYEPVWSIGTNLIPTNMQIKEMIDYIKSRVNTLFLAKPKVIYGGSVNKDNIDKLLEINSIDGFLVGGASVKPDEFLELLEKIKNS